MYMREYRAVKKTPKHVLEMCLCVQPVYHASSKVVRGYCLALVGCGKDKRGLFKKKKKNSTAEKHTLHSQCSPGADNNRIDFATIATRWGCIGQENIVN